MLVELIVDCLTQNCTCEDDSTGRDSEVSQMCTVLLIMLLNSVLSPIKCFMIVDVETRSHLTANYHVLTCTIIDYQELSFTCIGTCSKFFMLQQ